MEASTKSTSFLLPKMPKSSSSVWNKKDLVRGAQTGMDIMSAVYGDNWANQKKSAYMQTEAGDDDDDEGDGDSDDDDDAELFTIKNVSSETAADAAKWSVNAVDSSRAAASSASVMSTRFVCSRPASRGRERSSLDMRGTATKDTSTSDEGQIDALIQHISLLSAGASNKLQTTAAEVEAQTARNYLKMRFVTGAHGFGSAHRAGAGQGGGEGDEGSEFGDFEDMEADETATHSRRALDRKADAQSDDDMERENMRIDKELRALNTDRKAAFKANFDSNYDSAKDKKVKKQFFSYSRCTILNYHFIRCSSIYSFLSKYNDTTLALSRGVWSMLREARTGRGARRRRRWIRTTRE